VIEPEHKKPVFLLGGADLEMDAIRSLLVAEKAEYIDHGLSWETASLSSYEDVLNQYSPEEYNIYGIELNNDLTFPPYNYHEIDHHGKKDYLPSSLEQVATLLRHELTLEESLIAANDKWHIRGMRALLENAKDAKKMSVTEKAEMIQEIRIRDRKAQGVTPEEEIVAETEIAQGKFFVRDNLVVFQTGLNHFSPIVDRLSRYDRIVVFNESKLVIYGLGCHIVGAKLAERYSLGNGQTYSGGGSLGYWGIKEGKLSTETILQIAETIKSVEMEYSGHIFYFPFEWSLKEAEGVKALTGPWRKADPNENLYDERNYFYPCVHKLLYDDGNSMIRHFEMPCGKDARYVVKIKQGTDSVINYSLRLDHINLNLYSTGVGLLSFYCTNDTNLCEENGISRIMDKEDILRVNQYGRRVMPPFYADKEMRSETALELGVTGLDGFTDLMENFNSYTKDDYWKPASFICELIRSLYPRMEFKPVIDDRMYVMSWYRNSSLINEVKQDTHGWDHGRNNQFWYRYLFVDSGFPTCQDADMRASFLNDATYRRWLDWDSLYGITRYSMMYLASDGVPEYLINTFKTIYARMAEIVLMQRASLLNFSADVTRLSALLGSHDEEAHRAIRTLYMEYISFVNKFYHKEVTAQDQGIEMYQMMQKSLHLDEAVKDLDNDIGALYQYITMVDDKERGTKADLLNAIMGIFAPASFMVGIWGMSSICDVYCSGTFWSQIGIVAGFTAIIWILYKLPIWFRKQITHK
jgi:hypothetical protein